MPVSQALRAATQALGAVSDTPRLDAELLMAHALGVDRSALLTRHMDDAEPAAFAALLARRLGHEPVAYILGRQEFWSLDLMVSPAVLIPRGDSETLIEAAIDTLAGSPPAGILDLGTGSGALLLAALHVWPQARGIGIDASAAALAIAQANADSLGLADRATLRRVDWTTPGWTAAVGSGFDLVLANPPYIAEDAVLAPMVRDHEPHAALFAGGEGLDAYRRLIPALAMLVAPGGAAIFEIGAGQYDAVAAIAGAAGWDSACRQDLAGHPRALILRRNGTG